MSVLQHILITVGLIFLNIILLGLPATIPFSLAYPFIVLFFGKNSVDRLQDEVWPIIILTGIIWSLTFPFAYLLAYKWIFIKKYNLFFCITFFLVIGIITSILVFTFFYKWQINKVKK